MKQYKRLLAGALCCAALLGLAGCGNNSAQSVEPGSKLTYASEGVTVIDDPAALQKAVDEMEEKAAKPGVAMRYKPMAVSSDGIHFTGEIGNSARNTYDLYIQIFADEELEDELFLSGLLRPGEVFSNITLTHELEKGTHVVYCAFTQVEDDLETIQGQAIVTIEFVVE